jgi:hypothetical protein
MTKGSICKLAGTAKSKLMHTTTYSLSLNHSGKNAFSHIEYKGQI